MMAAVASTMLVSGSECALCFWLTGAPGLLFVMARLCAHFLSVDVTLFHAGNVFDGCCLFPQSEVTLC